MASAPRKIVFRMPSLIPEDAARRDQSPNLASAPAASPVAGGDVRKLATLLEVSQALVGTLSLQGRAVRGARGAGAPVRRPAGRGDPARGGERAAGGGGGGGLSPGHQPGPLPRRRGDHRPGRRAGRAGRGAPGERGAGVPAPRRDPGRAGHRGRELPVRADSGRGCHGRHPGGRAALRPRAGHRPDGQGPPDHRGAGVAGGTDPSPGRGRAPAPGGGEHPAARGAARALRVHQHRGQQRADAAGVRAGGPGGRHRRDGDDPRGVGHREGADRARAAPPLAARGEAVRPGQLRGAAREPGGDRAVRPRAGRLHRRPDAPQGQVRATPTAARCSSTRSGS